MHRITLPVMTAALLAVNGFAWAQQKATVAEVFNGDMLGTNLRYFESIAGIARQSFDNQHSYRVEGCEITATVSGTVVSALRLELSPQCKADIASFIGDSFAPPASRSLTFGNFRASAGDLSFFADCLAMCGNAYDPSVYAHWEGPRAVDFREVLLEAKLVGDQAIDAASRWRQDMSQVRGEDWVIDTKFNCERGFDAQAQQHFDAVEVTAITIGSELQKPGC